MSTLPLYAQTAEVAAWIDTYIPCSLSKDWNSVTNAEAGIDLLGKHFCFLFEQNAILTGTEIDVDAE